MSSLSLFDKKFLFVKGIIKRTVLYVNAILTAKILCVVSITEKGYIKKSVILRNKITIKLLKRALFFSSKMPVKNFF